VWIELVDQVPHVIKAIIRLLKNNAPPSLIDKKYIASFWAGGLEKDEYGRLVLRKQLKLPAIAVMEIVAGEKVDTYLGRMIGRSNIKRGILYHSYIWIDHWAYDTLQRDMLVSWTRRTMYSNYSYFRRKNIYNVRLISSYARGFDQGDRILQSHSHQMMQVQRLIDEWRVEYEVPLAEERRTYGEITAIEFTTPSNTEYLNIAFTVGSSNDPHPYFFFDDEFGMI